MSRAFEGQEMSDPAHARDGLRWRVPQVLGGILLLTRRSHPIFLFGAGFLLSNAPVQVGHAIKLSDLSESEIRFGIAPKRGPAVTYQDNIILMEQGDKAIQSFASDGMSWTFDANAAQVNDIQVGKVLFATDRCAGKVLAVQHNGGSVSVVLGPVQLNELVKEGNFAYDQPLDLNNAIAVPMRTVVSGGAGLHSAVYAGAVGSKALQEEIKSRPRRRKM